MKKASALLAISLLAVPSLLRADGALDPSFGDGGKVRIGWSPVGSGGFSAVAHQTDGRVVAAGQTQGYPGAPPDFVLMRFTQSGQLDSTFGVAGISIVSIGAMDHTPGMTILPNGKILLIGTSEGVGPLLARFDPDGSLDRSFGPNGHVLLQVPPVPSSAIYPRAVTLQSDGRVLIAGNIEGDPWGTFVLRRLPDGSADPSFGASGVVLLQSAPGARDWTRSVLVQTDLRIVVAGDADINGTPKFLAVRIKPNGELDDSFGVGGYATPSIPMGVSTGSTTGMLQQPGDLIVLSGGVRAPVTADQDFAMARLTPAGALDTSFGQGGWVQRGVSTGSVENVVSVLTISDRLIVVGPTSQGQSGHTFLARYSRDGDPDLSYGPSGTGILTSLFADPTKDIATGASVSPDGRLVVVGGIFENFLNQDFLALRFDPPCVASFAVSATTSVCPNGDGFAAAAMSAASFGAAAKGGAPGTVYTWAIRNGTILAGQGTEALHFRAGATGATYLTLNATLGACATQGTAQTFIDQPGCVGSLSFYTLTPCRAVDTRLAPDPAGGPSLAARRSRRFPIAGSCGVPADARAITANITVLSASAGGHLAVSAEGTPTPPTFVNAFRAGETRATSTQLTLGENGAIRVESMQPSGTVDVLVDVSGYYK